MIIIFTIHETQSKNAIKYPALNATTDQIKECASIVSKKVTEFLLEEHKYIITFALEGVSEEFSKYFDSKEIPDGKFVYDPIKDQLNLVLNINGPLVSGGDNAQAKRIDEILKSILGVGEILYLFNINVLSEVKLLPLDKVKINNSNSYFSIHHVFSKCTRDLSESISFEPANKLDVAEKFIQILNKILTNDDISNEILFSLSWYCQSLDYGGDDKTKFICRYIAFESLSGIWTKSDTNEKTSQDKLKYIISALLAGNVDDIGKNEKIINEIIKLRNELFHGKKAKNNIETFNRRISQQYSSLGTLYDKLFQYTLNKINV
jgi:hypothetical protein